LNDRFGLIAPGDTLWSIASRVRPNKRISVQQMMLALQDENPDAFVNNNINYLKVGFVLRIPEEAEIKSASTVSAIEEVISQNKEYEALQTSDVAKVLAPKVRDDERFILLETEFTLANEDLKRLREINTELVTRLEDVNDQVDGLSDLLEQKSEQLVALNARLQEQEADKSRNAVVPSLMRRQKSDALLEDHLILGGLGLFLIGLFLAVLLMFRLRKRDVERENDEPAKTIDIEEREYEPSLNYPTSGSDGHDEMDYSDERDMRKKGDTNFEPSNLEERDDFYYELDEDDLEFESIEEVTKVFEEDLVDGFEEDKVQLNTGGREPGSDLDEISEVVLGDDDLDFEDDSGFEEDAGSKIDLARAYIEMGDSEGARPLLEDVINSGSEAQISEAKELLEGI
jgi:pilus assembly protein FimV